MADHDSSGETVPRSRGALLALCFCLVWVLFWYWDTVTAMVTIWWRSETFAHAFLVPPITLWLIWRRRQQLAAIPPQPWWPAVALLGLVGFGWLLGEISAVNAVTQFALVSMVALTVPSLFGLRRTWAMLFPLAFLFFSVPIGEFVIPQFRDWTADFTVMALRLTGIPVYREGTHFVIPSGSWSVIEACSGVRYLIASLVVGTLYAYLNYRTLKKRLVFIAFAIIVPIVANWLRAYMIVMLGHLSGNKLAVGVDHVIYGWVFFGVVMILMYFVGARWADNPGPAEADVGRNLSFPAVKTARIWPVAFAFLVMVPLPRLWLMEIDRTELARGISRSDLALTAFQGWQIADRREINWTPAYKGMTKSLQEEFVKDGRRVGIFVGYYRRQDYDHKLISSKNELVISYDHVWNVVGIGSREATIDGQSVVVDTAELKEAYGQRLSVWRWYWVNGHLTNNDYLAKLYQAFGRLLGRGDDSAVVIIYTPMHDRAGSNEVLEVFAHDVGNQVDQLLGHPD